MTPEHWQRIKALYEEATELPVAGREAWLVRLDAEDAALRREVEAMLAADKDSRFLNEPALAHTERAAQTERRAALIGRRLGHYQVLAAIGAGGMGEIYLARDLQLEREVALKVLPAQFTADAERVRRFAQEARATSALNHPNILTVHDIGEHEGAPYLVAELLEGAELRALLPPLADALPVSVALDYARQIVAGLSAAHEKGIVHRDLKPENLFVINDGRVKILDFGLAKLKPPKFAGAAEAQPLAERLTGAGVIMGTVGYMSPEQVRGEEVDQRSDLFSFGAILYEMLAGEQAFHRESMAETMATILKEEPPELCESNKQVSPQLAMIVRHCLEKKTEMRFQSARDLGFALKSISTSSVGNSAGSASILLAKNGWRDRRWMIVAEVLSLIALAMIVAYFNRSAADTRSVRLAFVPSENLAFDNGLYDYVIVSPDGQKLVFTGRSADGKRQLWVRPLDSMEATPLPGTDDAFEPFWSPDSRSLGFGSQGKLKRIDLAGGRPQTLCDASFLRGGTWNRAGVILFAPGVGRGLFQIPATGGGEPKPVTSPDPARHEDDHRNPCFLPDGRHFLYRVFGREGVFVGLLDSKEVKQLLMDETSAIYAPPGWLLFVRNGALLAQPFDADHLELKGEAVPLTRPTNNANVINKPFSVAENGVLIWQGDRLREYQLVWFDRAGRQGGTVGPPIKVIVGQAPLLSPDGKRVAIHRSDPQIQNSDIWVIDLAHNLPTRLTSDPALDERPIWSPDGRRVVFESIRGGVNGLYQKAVSGVGTEELLLKVGDCAPTGWSADGRFIFYSTRAEKKRRDVWALPLFGDRQPSALLNSEFDEYRAQLSPDGRWLAYVSDESGSYDVYVQPFSADGKLGSNKQRISTNGGNHPRFRRNGRELFYVAADGQMMDVALKASGATFEFEPPKPLFKTRMLTGLTQSGIEYDVTADGQRFLIGTMVGEANATPVSVILNWTAGLQR